jgi:hypothetical protein
VPSPLEPMPDAAQPKTKSAKNSGHYRNCFSGFELRRSAYGYVKGIALDPEGWQPLIAARPDWFEVIHLNGTTGPPRSYLNALRTVPEIVDFLNP